MSSFSVLPSVHTLYGRCYLGHKNDLQLLSRFAQHRIMLLFILQWFLSQTEKRQFEVNKNMAVIIHHFCLLHPISTLLHTANISKTHSHGQWVLSAPKRYRDSDWQVALNVLTDAIGKFNWIGQSQHINNLTAFQLIR